MTGEWPSDFLQTVMISLEKKANATDCRDFRTISLTLHVSKIMLNILTKRIEGKVTAVNCITEEQFGFRIGMGTRYAIGVLRSLAERSLQHNKDVDICFIDYKKAFDRVYWYQLMRALVRLHVDWRHKNKQHANRTVPVGPRN